MKTKKTRQNKEMNMFVSDPICILTAGSDVNGNTISQTLIDEMADSYNTGTYTARIFKEGERYTGGALGSVLSLEKQGNQLFATLSPNSKLLRSVELGQSLHSACEYIKEFAGTGKAYLTGLTLTDKPSSLGTTQIHLSVIHNNSDAQATAPHKKSAQLCVLQSDVTRLTAQTKQLTEKANALIGKLEQDESSYL